MKDAVLYRLQCLVIQDRNMARHAGKPGVNQVRQVITRDIDRAKRVMLARYGVRVTY